MNTSNIRKRNFIVGLCCLLFTLICWGNTVYIFAKAQLAQYLIEDAWHKTLADGKVHLPWSWADTWPVLRLQNDRLEKDLFVLAGASGSSLAFGPGLLDGGAFPGERGRAVIGGHRDTHFKFLQNLRKGDKLYLQSADGRWLKYVISDLEIKNSETDTIEAWTPSSELLLITCYPFDSLNPGGPLRYVATASLN